MPYTGSIRGWGHILQENGIRVESIGKLHYRYAEDPAGFDVEHIPMNVYQGVGMVWGSIRDPLPDEPPASRMLGEYIGPGESTYTEYDRSVANLTVDWLRDAATREKPTNRGSSMSVSLPRTFRWLPRTSSSRSMTSRACPRSKLLPEDGFPHHPWIAEPRCTFWRHDDKFKDEAERKTAIAAYHALCSWVDHNVGRVLNALDETGLTATTRVIYTSDHGDNVGQRGLWGKSNLYQESTTVPMIMTGPDITAGQCETPVTSIGPLPDHH